MPHWNHELQILQMSSSKMVTFYKSITFCFQFDVKNQRIFLRRTKYEGLHQEDLFIGNRVSVFSRQLNLIEYGDQYTANKLGSKKERYDWLVFHLLYGSQHLLLKPCNFALLDSIFSLIS